mgnify:CR=1 FL=1
MPRLSERTHYESNINDRGVFNTLPFFAGGRCWQFAHCILAFDFHNISPLRICPGYRRAAFPPGKGLRRAAAGNAPRRAACKGKSAIFGYFNHGLSLQVKHQIITFLRNFFLTKRSVIILTRLYTAILNLLQQPQKFCLLPAWYSANDICTGCVGISGEHKYFMRDFFVLRNVCNIICPVCIAIISK